MTHQIVLIKLDTGDCGLFVNKKLILHELNKDDKFDAMASSLATVLDGNLTVIQAKKPSDPFWLWPEVAGGALDAGQEAAKPQVLVIVSGGVADYVADECVDVVVFDRDNYNDDPVNTELPPAHFADLADAVGVPHEGQSPKKSVARAFRR